MAGRSSNATSTRDRLLLAAGQLLHEAGDGPVSTRAICERAGVQAPTLYHHFGSKQGLLDAVVNYGFTQYVQAPDAGGDPVDRIRAGWDRHVEYGLAHPVFYVLLYGQIEPGVPCNLTSSAEALLLELFTPLAREGRLRVEAAEAARQFAAANSGVTLSLIAQPADDRDPAMSAQVRESVLAGLLADEPAGGSSVGALAVALSTALADDVDALTTTERQMLREWLHRIAG
ncbi:TetR/AcrR family transcriptional regulator [Amycolatopsis sp. FBCC-B4732]|uniref:TetR/AcrR family transcriptional regulator n=1 Tax=Amycolatopsis sp. FBCC-B4732 TaxID=3079339 RepID=UPI001FF3EEA6|nr:TetR/AcrR family transcriptional regulator [Amycolatopsis sp. FBCC-B4732]UOX88948.1 TetR/AcrR family transcriptional regulator [Amycolatopsis sp. FBCC-B4732]